MMKLLKDNIYRVCIFLIPIIVSALGIVIKNLYLSKFNLIEYSFFHSESIIIGTVFIFFYVITFYYMVTFVNVLEPENNNNWLVLILSVIKIFLVSIFFYNLFIGNYNMIYTFMNYQWLRSTITILIISSIIFMLLYYDYNKISFKELRFIRKIIKLVLFLFIVIICIIMLVLGYILLKDEPSFKPIFKFFSFFSLFFTGIHFIRLKTLKKLIPYLSSDNKHCFYRVGYALTLFVILTSFAVFGYSLVIFPEIPQNYGGGKTEVLQFYLDNNVTVNGRIIHSNSDLVYILCNDDNSVIITEWKSLRKIER